MSRIESLASPVPFGKYLLTDRIAVGRMAEVFKAKRDGVEGFEKILVVKRLYPSLAQSKSFVDAFVEESKTTVSLSHANIVQVLDLGQHEDDYFMAMEYVSGYDLGTVLEMLERTGGTFPMDVAVFTASEVAKGLDYAHRRKDYNFESLNIVHRDMSPENVLISFEGEVKISDFGVARAMDIIAQDLGDTRRRMLYASPEQARMEEMTHRSDIFSLGLILYRLLTGSHPYDAPTVSQIREKARAGAVPPIETVVDINPALAKIIASMLQANPADRVDSAGTLYEELISYLFASGQKADNRSLSEFMRGLRSGEDAIYVVGDGHLRPPDFAMGPAVRTAHDPPLGAVDAQASAMPPRLEELAAAARSGQGAAVALSRGLGVGASYLPDRLSEALGAREMQVVEMYVTDDLSVTPVGLVRHLIHHTIGVLPLGRFGATLQTQRDWEADSANIERLRDFGLSDEELAVAQQVSAMTLGGGLGWEVRKDTLTALAGKLVRGLAQTTPMALIVDRVDQLDPTSRDILGNLGALARHLPMLVVIAPSPGVKLGDLATLKTDQGSVFELLDGDHGPSELDAAMVLASVNPDAAQMLALMALVDQPVQTAFLTQALGMERGAADAPLQALRDVGALRMMIGDRVAVATPALGDAVMAAWSRGAIPRPYAAVESALAAIDRLDVAGPLSGDVAWLPARARLRVALGAGREVSHRVPQVGMMLYMDGWREPLLNYCVVLRRFLTHLPAGDLDGLLELEALQARVALDLMRIDAAEAGLTEALIQAQRTGDVQRAQALRAAQARVALMRGDAWPAYHLLQDVFLEADHGGYPNVMARTRLIMGQWHLWYGNLPQAQDHLEAAFNLLCTLAPSPDVVSDLASTLEGLVDAIGTRGQIVHAASLQMRLERMAEASPDPLLGCLKALGRAHLARATGNPQQAMVEAEAALELARSGALIAMGVRLALEIAEAAFEANEPEKAHAYGAILQEMGRRYDCGYASRRGAELVAYAGVVSSKGDASLESLKGLHSALSQAREDQSPRHCYDAHTLLFRALSHMGSVVDAEQHRQAALRYAIACGAGGSRVNALAEA